MAKRFVGCLHDLHERNRNLPIMLDRLKEIRDEMNRLSGVLQKLSPERLSRQPDYWLTTLQGWSKRLQTLGNELVIVQTEIAKHLLQ